MSLIIKYLLFLFFFLSATEGRAERFTVTVRTIDSVTASIVKPIIFTTNKDVNCTKEGESCEVGKLSISMNNEPLSVYVSVTPVGVSYEDLYIEYNGEKGMGMHVSSEKRGSLDVIIKGTLHEQGYEQGQLEYDLAIIY